MQREEGLGDQKCQTSRTSCSHVAPRTDELQEIGSFIVGRDLNQQQQKLFKMDERRQIRIMLILGVLGHQPAIKAVCIVTVDQYENVADALYQQKTGIVAKQRKVRKVAVEAEDRFKTKKARLDVNSAIKWQRAFKAPCNEEEGDQKKIEDDGKAKYSTRRITCERCMVGMETKHMQLHTPKGYRDLYCKTCGNHFRCGEAKCQCAETWHRCETHRVDPVVHKSKKASRKAKRVGPHEQCEGKHYLRPGPMCPKKSVKRKRDLEQKEWQQMYNWQGLQPSLHIAEQGAHRKDQQEG